MDLFDRIMEMAADRFECAQIMAMLFLELTGQDNDEFVKAMGGLCGGIGYSGDCCGCMAAGCCLISYAMGRGAADEEAHGAYKEALAEFTEWFTEALMISHGSIDCTEIIEGNPANRVRYCPEIIADAFEKCIEILQSRGVL